MSDNIQTNTTGRLTPCLQQKIDKPRYFVALLLSCELWTYLADLNEQAEKRLDIIMEQMKIVEGVTDELKAQNHWESRPPAKPNIINLRKNPKESVNRFLSLC